jgi:hypothetical protein
VLPNPLGLILALFEAMLNRLAPPPKPRTGPPPQADVLPFRPRRPVGEHATTMGRSSTVAMGAVREFPEEARVR